LGGELTARVGVAVIIRLPEVAGAAEVATGPGEFPDGLTGGVAVEPDWSWQAASKTSRARINPNRPESILCRLFFIPAIISEKNNFVINLN
jgi:hypothetical protein